MTTKHTLKTLFAAHGLPIAFRKRKLKRNIYTALHQRVWMFLTEQDSGYLSDLCGYKSENDLIQSIFDSSLREILHIIKNQFRKVYVWRFYGGWDQGGLNSLKGICIDLEHFLIRETRLCIESTEIHFPSYSLFSRIRFLDNVVSLFPNLSQLPISEPFGPQIPAYVANIRRALQVIDLEHKATPPDSLEANDQFKRHFAHLSNYIICNLACIYICACELEKKNSGNKP